MISETITDFLSKGIRHKAVVQEKKRHIDAEVATVAMVALELIRLHPALDQISQNLLDQIANCVEDCAYPVSIPESLRLCDKLERSYSEWPALCRALELTQSLLLGESTVWNYYIEDNVGRTRFCDMDLLWEQAVYNMVKLLCIGTDLKPIFHPFGGADRLLLEDGARTIDPDIVIFSPSLAPIVVDAKYSIASSANNADIYQMLAYLRSIDARCAILAYLGDHEWTEVIGKDGDRLLVAVGLSVSDVRASGARTLSPHLTATVTSDGQR